MDNNDLERERGITIRAKHCTVEWDGYLINIIDTPGHADFSGEVERVLSMVDSVLLLVDANEGPMPQTRYVLMRALRLGLRPSSSSTRSTAPTPTRTAPSTRPSTCSSNWAPPTSRPTSPCSTARAWTAGSSATWRRTRTKGMDALFETIVAEVPPPQVDLDAPFRMQVSTLAWSDYIGRIGCGRVLAGAVTVGDELLRITHAH